MAESGARVKPHVTLGVELALVGLGGMVGTLSRYGVGAAVANWNGADSTGASSQAATLIVNIVGAFALGVLVTILRRTAEQDRIGMGRAERLRLLLGTGVLGGFTTYSGLATLSSEMLVAGQVMGAIGYAGVTVIVGLIASLAGMWLGGIRSVARDTARKTS